MEEKGYMKIKTTKFWGLIVLSFFVGAAFISMGSDNIKQGDKPKTSTSFEDTKKDSTNESSAQVEKVAPTQNEAVALKPIKLAGTGNKATDFVVLTAGLRRFVMTHTGSSNFIVKLLDENGDPAGGSFGLNSVLANEIGNYNGSVAVKLDKEGKYMLNIDADGAWTVDIE